MPEGMDLLRLAGWRVGGLAGWRVGGLAGFREAALILSSGGGGIVKNSRPCVGVFGGQGAK